VRKLWLAKCLQGAKSRQANILACGEKAHGNEKQRAALAFAPFLKLF
jgi:hypothetical protein